MTAIETEIELLKQAIDEKPDDWDTRLVYADALEQQGAFWEAAAQRYLVHLQRCPMEQFVRSRRVMRFFHEGGKWYEWKAEELTSHPVPERHTIPFDLWLFVENTIGHGKPTFDISENFDDDLPQALRYYRIGMEIKDAKRWVRIPHVFSECTGVGCGSYVWAKGTDREIKRCERECHGLNKHCSFPYHSMNVERGTETWNFLERLPCDDCE